MKNKELYERTVNILVQAYFNDTLEHTNCYACAVGNIIAGNNGIGFIKTPGDWNEVIYDNGMEYEETPLMIISNYNRYNRDYKKVEKFIINTGYSINQLKEIESAFEGANEDGDWMFNGLMAVIDVLDKIHENRDFAATQITKSKFNKQLV